MSVAIIGCGVMGEAILSQSLVAGLVASQQTVCTAYSQQRLDYLRETYGVQVSIDNASAVTGATIVVLAVKPQVLPAVMAQLRPNLAPEALIISLVAGVSLAALEAGLGTGRLVRVMPNTAAKIGEGMSVWTCTSSVQANERGYVQSLLTCMGEAAYVELEGYVDMATAICGSGPAFVFVFMEAMVEAGVRLGLPRLLTQQLVSQTVKGAGMLSQAANLSVLRSEVTSPGGTTAEGLQALERAGFRGIVGEGVWAAYQRSQQIKGIGCQAEQIGQNH